MKNDDPIAEGLEQGMIVLSEANNNIDDVPDAVANFLLVHSAQGVIDNGGYRYFFESDWPNQPSYSSFIRAYKEIGCERQAEDFERVVSTFPFEKPHAKEAERNRYMNENYDEDQMEVKGWGERLCGDREVWEKLKEYYKQHKKIFV